MSIEYLAGFFDGEACIRGALQPSGVLVISVNISLKNPEPLIQLKGHFDVGTIALYPQYPPYKYYSFTAYAKNAGKILSGLYDNLVVKKEEATLALKALEISSNSLTEQNKTELAKICHALKEAKRRPLQISKILERSLDHAS